GYFEEANGGTLFLDEITEMSAEMQIRLLRVLEERTLRRVGGSQDLKLDVRLLSATNRDPVEAMQAGKLREDLYYRLNVFPLCMPPLTDRPEDIPILAEHFRREIEKQEKSGVINWDPKAMDLLRAYDWPGNVRELRNIVHRAYILTEGATISSNVVRGLLPAPKQESERKLKSVAKQRAKTVARTIHKSPRRSSSKPAARQA